MFVFIGQRLRSKAVYHEGHEEHEEKTAFAFLNSGKSGPLWNARNYQEFACPRPLNPVHFYFVLFVSFVVQTELS